MGFDRADVLDELALYPDRCTRGMSRPEMLEALGYDISHADRLSKVLGRASAAGLVRREGTRRGSRWFITTRGMSWQPAEDWMGESWGWTEEPADDSEWDHVA